MDPPRTRGRRARRCRPGPAAAPRRGALAAAVLDGKIHAVGGVGSNGHNTPAHEIYDPASDRWTAAAPVPTARDHLAVVTAVGHV